ncbi:sensor domain-containing diguanylate cyclase [Aliivibrio sp. S4TY2]|uniref:sensor domain-containing diguanylate cyclase n=2 Tax=Aliivibrio TaxID=511678 RepID=UPI0023786D69|nr:MULTISPECIES: sensor domain-containing diguanylate cyclase [unclassified Aliivibrio]MDD9157530.1 sensor domain-containing diguanylate cyclase [Aliivibrio sp. S4TY2]MDD9161507.1 sensor domain-containing diguanylate cyclase [Aliivibrio sp. S4TY1]MDD9165440.1 sensor domain-containing diguanylate cyclase [Aliivibrio sp. S4MY2]MDD9169536.1 sensor domain-containing diguanylate cyclase [Aliivibrio sp. S4MY4]MDD9186529.1 sensor domain-containing diguanylate cyclase [Aliivibrio sp. S4MY3]
MLKKTIVFVLFLSSLFMAELCVVKINGVDNEKRINDVIYELNQSIGLVFNDAVISSEVLKEIVRTSKNSTIALTEFNRVSEILLADYSDLDSILLLPNGVVSYVYPYDENKNAIGHDVLNDENRKRGSLESILKKDTTIIGPVKLVQNGKKAFIIRKTILSGNDFWGFTSSVVYLDSIINMIDNILLKHGFVDYLIVGYNPDGQSLNEKLISSKGNFSNKSLKGVIYVFNTSWELYTAKNSPKLSIRMFMFFLVSIVFIITVLVFRYFKNNKKENKLLKNETHTDFLTGLINRRGFEYKLKLLKNNELIYGSIAIFDIDFFKAVNDKYGHDAGDEILVKFANVCMMNLPAEYILSRSGGDEFILLMPGLDIIRAKEVCECLRLAIYKERFTTSKTELEITTSIGVSSYSNVVNIRSALNIADKALYIAKEDGRNRVFTF